MKIEVIDASIATLKVDAIVNAANGYPAHEAAEIAAREVSEFLISHADLRVVFSCFGVAMVRGLERALERAIPSPRPSPPPGRGST